MSDPMSGIPPTVGRIVHTKIHILGIGDVLRPAIVLGVHNDGSAVELKVFGKTDRHLAGVLYAETPSVGYWSWPKRVP